VLAICWYVVDLLDHGTANKRSWFVEAQLPCRVFVARTEAELPARLAEVYQEHTSRLPPLQERHRTSLGRSRQILRIGCPLLKGFQRARGPDEDRID